MISQQQRLWYPRGWFPFLGPGASVGGVVPAFLAAIALAAAPLLALPGPARAQIYTAELRPFGGKGTGTGRFDYAPRALALDKAGNLWACDNTRVHKFSPTGKPLLSFGARGTGPGQFHHFYGPTGLAVRPDGGAVFVSDLGGYRVHKFDAKGRHLLSFGTKGTGPGQFDQPYALALDKAGNLYAVDARNRRVQVFTPGGKFLRAFGQGHLRAPHNDVEVGPDGHIYVPDRDAQTVAVFAPDGRLARRLGGKEGGKEGGQGSTSKLRWPIGVAFDGQGRLHVLEDAERVKVFDKGGLGGRLTSQFSGLGAPGAIAVDPKTGDVFVSMGAQHHPRVVKYRRRHLAP